MAEAILVYDSVLLDKTVTTGTDGIPVALYGNFIDLHELHFVLT